MFANSNIVVSMLFTRNKCKIYINIKINVYAGFDTKYGCKKVHKTTPVTIKH